MYRLILSADVTLVNPEGVEIALSSAKAKALLAFLAMPPGRSRTRDEIVALLWSDRGEEQGRASLRQVLTQLRKALGADDDLLHIAQNALALNAKRLTVLPGTGDAEFLSALRIRDPAFEEWVRDERLRLDTAEDAREQATPSPAVPSLPSIGVLPFETLSQDAGQERFADGMTQDVITALSKIPKLFVVARSSTEIYRGAEPQVDRVGQEQGVRYVLKGSIRREGNRLRLSAQLIDAVSGQYIWAQRYDRDVGSLFDLQDEMTRQVASALQVEITEGDQARLWASGTTVLEAWECVAQVASLMFGHRREDLLKGRALAERALQLDDTYASAWVWLGWSHVEEVFNGWAVDAERSLDLAMNAGARARDIDASNPEVHIALGFTELCRRNFDAARAHVKTAISLGPNNAFAYGVAACVGQYCNAPDEMIPLLEKAKRLCPIYPAWYAETLGWAHLLKGRYAEAISLAREAVARDPEYIYSFIVLAIAYQETGRMAEAQAAVAEILRVAPDYSLSKFAKTQPFSDKAVLDRHLAGLEGAGLPK
ncbi:tetratricopeptide repeat protein [Ovoidimarina sediminis]|uniref:tetratricopeptide repeat protein n=1 Tax=Ovoidimarina sediminis TaxID=3079856 RepID=UPI002908E7DB|nr:tetratricopeptide repeat protein [Rhodophyticola sp. MJ-SS7]MDU8945395.1 tetratricopeptide repeat protein [Rhodophyticola sp. MJ-SS7]